MLEHLMNELLANACGSMSDEEVQANNGYQKYSIGLHCYDVTVEARLTDNGEFIVNSYEFKAN